MRRVLDSAFFHQPGFQTLFDAWYEAFEKDENGNYILTPAEVIAATIKAKNSAMVELADPTKINELENVACRYAQEMPIQIEEVLYA